MSTNVDQALMQAYEAIEQDQLEEAQTILEPLLDSHADNPDVWWVYAHAVRDPNEAKIALDNVRHLQPDYPGADELNREVEAQLGTQPGAVRRLSESKHSAASKTMSDSEIDDILGDLDDFEEETAAGTPTDDDFGSDLDDDIFGDDDDFDLGEDDFGGVASAEDEEDGRGRSLLLRLLALVLLIVVIIAAALLLLGGGDDDGAGGTTDQPTSVAQGGGEASETEEAAASTETEEAAASTEDPFLQQATQIIVNATASAVAAEGDDPTDAPTATDEPAATEEPIEPSPTEEPTEEVSTEMPDPTDPPTETPADTEEPSVSLNDLLADFETPSDDPTETGETALGNTRTINICTQPGSALRDDLNNVMALLANEYQAVVGDDDVDAIAARMLACEDNTVLRYIGVPVQAAIDFSEGNITEADFRGQWRVAG